MTLVIGDVCDFNQSRDRTNASDTWEEIQDAFVCGMKEWQSEASFIPIAMVIGLFLMGIIGLITFLIYLISKVKR